jgi:hypothetical protein
MANFQLNTLCVQQNFSIHPPGWFQNSAKQAVSSRFSRVGDDVAFVGALSLVVRGFVFGGE